MCRRNPVRPSVTPLEAREVPTVFISMSAPDTLVIVGDNGNDSVLLRDNGAGFINGYASGFGAFAVSGIRTIRIATNGGNDLVGYALAGNLRAGQQRTVAVDLGSSCWWGGCDQFVGYLYNPFTGVGADLLAGSSLSITVLGGDGMDLISVNASRDTDVAAGARLSVNLAGGSGDDTLRTNWYGQNDGSVSLRADGGSGWDLVRGRLREQSGSTGQLSGVVAGGGGADDLALFLFTENPAVEGRLDGGDGCDVAVVSLNVAVVGVP
ncbi:MAG TPA: hypothetical protein VKD90_14755 [Gemmataceae bacterium]|nr:hypothetical protein [Gemmataceae bacterium]